MPYYHATFRDRLPSILKHGLGGITADQNWGCTPGVYLSKEPAICAFIMLEHYVEYGDHDSIPREHFERIVIIVIDDSRVDASKLVPDESINREDVRRYTGVIDVRNMPIINLLDLAK